MNTKMTTIILAVIVSLNLVIVTGCETGGQTGAAIGSLAGAGIGQLAGGSTEATLIGAAVGGGAGYIVGNESDNPNLSLISGSEGEREFSFVSADGQVHLIDLDDENSIEKLRELI